jgi:hypothetical protein
MDVINDSMYSKIEIEIKTLMPINITSNVSGDDNTTKANTVKILCRLFHVVFVSDQNPHHKNPSSSIRAKSCKTNTI